MDKIQNQKHPRETFYYGLSRMFERASFYGFRTLVVLYMTGEVLKMDNAEAFSIYGFFVGALVFSQIIGALFGDLLIGNRKSVIIGGILQAIGAFTLCLPSTIGLYVGLFLIVLGSGFFTPNIISNFGKLYLNKTKLLDSGFTIFYLAINLGSFFGIILIGYLGDSFGYNTGFIGAGILMLLAIVPILFSKEPTLNAIDKCELPINKRIVKISIAMLVVALFWGIYEIANIRFFDLQMQLIDVSTLSISKTTWQSINAIFMIPVSLIAIVLWTYFYSSQFFKLTIGFIFGVLSLGLLFLIPEVPTDEHTMFYLVSLLFLAISEIHIAPIIHSILTKYANPKYLAILISLAFVPTTVIHYGFGLYITELYDNPILGLTFAITSMAIIGVGLVGYIWWDKKKPSV
ncbi:MFS transporter [Flavobacterium sp. SM2513]|uniref:MFS transporter n=1 Tax=Flavobacterium sp. SM2513 TaxID=3424766 RepID=UPI003D7F2459